MEKQAVREAVWDAFDAGDQARFPFPPHDRIPNFAGAADACDRLTETDAWASAATLKCNPDAPQLPVRRAALRAGKTVYVAQPRLRDADPFLRLDPDDIAPEEFDDATTVSGISEYGVPTAPEDVSHVDLVVAGSVGVTTDGARIGKGEGYSDLEWGVLSELGAVNDDATVVATTVHELSVLDGPESPIADAADLPAPDAHDVPLDLVVTPERTIRTGTPYARPTGIDWDALGEDKLDAIPVLAERAPGRE
ncbi:5-formyltetrahydrofolate cyclo-ligase [Halorubrum saccharovorum DSM 1137]|uniref:5-formyltetrahydrofolate cyclo-ligase n=1 Tax=Halorubrum saccharovorum DSM 1137 TaxID=1227484 RepID=M0E753_9EURY|nr:5-formyltetrahydrofolate cyclo-ligase [Halorubrum saccharovorum]ELZ43580.1 5-formyltetrahydrofolate cyclo-ligase [Halorubrum saccharovorum DSM 1137]